MAEKMSAEMTTDEKTKRARRRVRLMRRKKRNSRS
jgi:hypothetical protein